MMMSFSGAVFVCPVSEKRVPNARETNNSGKLESNDSLHLLFTLENTTHNDTNGARSTERDYEGYSAIRLEQSPTVKGLLWWVQPMAW